MKGILSHESETGKGRTFAFREGTTEEQKRQMRRNRLVMLVMFCFVALIGLRVMNIQSHSPEYDEIWTVQHYVGLPVAEILSDVATPNNHVLNTLAIKFFSAWVPNFNFAMRLPALLGLAGLFVILLRATLLLLKNKAARGSVLAVVLLDGMILHYAETARGYSLQIFFVFGLLFSLLCISEGKKENRTFNSVMWLLCALGSCLSVSSGVLYAAILTILWILLYIPFREGVRKIWQDYRPLIVAGACCSVFVLAWYGGNYSKFAAGQARFGESFSSLPQYFGYCWNILRDTGLAWGLLIVIAGGVWLRREYASRICALTGAAAVLMLVSAMFTKGGPARVYLPLIPVVYFGAGTVLDELIERVEWMKTYGMAVFLAVLVGCAYASEPRRTAAADPDMGIIFSEVKKQDPRVLVSYRPTDSYVLVTLFGDEARLDNTARLQNPELLMLLQDNTIGTMRFRDSDTVFLQPGCRELESGKVAPERMQYWLYRLRPVRPGESLTGKAVLCFVHGMIPELMAGNSGNWLKDNFSVVNGMLTRGSSSFCFAAPGDRLDANELLKIWQSRQGRVFFKVLTD